MARSARNDNSFSSERLPGKNLAAGVGEIGELVRRPAAESVDAASGEREPRRVLIVDDDIDAANTLSMLLGMLGHHTKVAYSAEEALACTEVFKPDVGLLDIGLPGVSGYELARRLRANPRLAGVRLIAITGYGRAEDRQRSASAGFDDHLVKPAELETIESTLASFAVGSWSHSGSDAAFDGQPWTHGRGESR